MKRYDRNIKTTAIKLLREKGVKETAEELGISIQTLYKWRNEDKLFFRFRTEAPTPEMEDMVRILRNDDVTDIKIERLDAENIRLRRTITLMRKALLAMLD